MDRKALEALLQMAYNDGYRDAMNDLRKGGPGDEEDENEKRDQ